MASTVEPQRSVLAADVIAQAEHNRQALGSEGPHPYLSGIHTPMREEVTIENLTVTGEIPAELSGRYVRIGPNPVAPDPRGYHWFSGDGMLHGLAIAHGQALWYRNRWIRSKPVAEALGEAPAPGPRIGRTDTVNTNVIGIGDRTWAMIEAGSAPVSMSDTLDDQRYDDFGGTLTGTFTAHPHRDPATGNLHAIAYEGGAPTIIRYMVVSPKGRVLTTEPITVEHGPSIHDCAITARHVLILDLPVTFSMDALMAGQRFPYRWNTLHTARVGVLPFGGRDEDVVWCDVEPCYVFHTGNAFENADGTITLDVIAYERMFEGDTQGPSGRTLGLERWTIDPGNRSVARATIDDSAQEFPRFDERRSGSRYQYLYAIAVDDEGGNPPTCVFKHDLLAGDRHVHDFGAGRIPGEFVFVARAAGTGEDDGWLIGLVIDRDHDTTDLVFLDARDIAGPPLASVRLPHRIPPGFHGSWIAAQ